MPGAYRREQETMDVKIKKKRPPTALGRSDIRYMGRAGRVYVARQYAPRPPTLLDLSVQQFRTRGRRPADGPARRRRLGPLGAATGSGTWRTAPLRLFADDREWVASFRRYGDSRYVEQPDEFARRRATRST